MNLNKDLKSIKITVYGRVQGVGFRYSTLHTAKNFNVSGFVKNQIDGSVYIEAEGKSQNLDLFIDWCKRGPSYSRIDNINIENQPLVNFSGFFIQ